MLSYRGCLRIPEWPRPKRWDAPRVPLTKWLHRKQHLHQKFMVSVMTVAALAPRNCEGETVFSNVTCLVWKQLMVKRTSFQDSWAILFPGLHMYGAWILELQWLGSCFLVKLDSTLSFPHHDLWQVKTQFLSNQIDSFLTWGIIVSWQWSSNSLWCDLASGEIRWRAYRSNFHGAEQNP